jgi:hypothetical protein
VRNSRRRRHHPGRRHRSNHAPLRVVGHVRQE